MAFQDDHICAGLKAGTDSAIHGVQTLWDKNLTLEDWGVLLVDAKNTFNDINRVRILWTVRHLLPSGARFSLTFIFNGHCLSYETGMGRPVFYIVERA